MQPDATTGRRMLLSVGYMWDRSLPNREGRSLRVVTQLVGGSAGRGLIEHPVPKPRLPPVTPTCRSAPTTAPCGTPSRLILQGDRLVAPCIRACHLGSMGVAVVRGI
jgi:hypothetical protein